MRQQPAVKVTFKTKAAPQESEFGSITETRQIKQNTVPGQVDSQTVRELKIGRRVIAREALQRER